MKYNSGSNQASNFKSVKCDDVQPTWNYENDYPWLVWHKVLLLVSGNHINNKIKATKSENFLHDSWCIVPTKERTTTTEAYVCHCFLFLKTDGRTCWRIWDVLVYTTSCLLFSSKELVWLCQCCWHFLQQRKTSILLCHGQPKKNKTGDIC